MKIVLNGQSCETLCHSLAELIVQSGLESSSLIAEVNFTIIKECDWQKTKLSEGDNIELLQFVGGG